MKPSTTVLLEVPPYERGVKTLYEVFSWGQEAHGEYLYYGEIDSSAVKPDGTGDISKASVHAMVSVNFESDVILATAGDLRNYQAAIGSQVDSFEAWLSQAGRAEMSPDEVCQHLKQVPEVLIDVSQRSWRRLMINAQLNWIVFAAAIIDESRVTEIAVSAQNKGASLRWLWGKFDELCGAYRDIPLIRFHGAPRD